MTIIRNPLPESTKDEIMRSTLLGKRIMSDEDIREICTWKYEKPYDVYDFPDYESLKRDGWAVSDKKKRLSEFRSVMDKDELIGWYRLFMNNGKVYLSLGLKPEECGHGRGKSLLELVLSDHSERFKGNDLILNVRSFNQRAISLYSKFGFIITGKREAEILGKNVEMFIMERKYRK